MASVTGRIKSDFCLLIGEMLLASGRISHDQLQAATQKQQASGERLGQTLVKLGYLSEEDLVQFLEAQLTQRLSASPNLRKQLGELLLEKQAISRWQLSQALLLQDKLPQKIGQLLIELGYTTRGRVEQALSDQNQNPNHQPIHHNRRTLGQLLLQLHRLTPAELESALQEQRTSQHCLGDILIRQGKISEDELEDLLAVQLLFNSLQDQTELQPVQKRLGEILVETHQLSQHQLNEIVSKQKSSKTPVKLGVLLLSKGLVSLRELKRALRLQKRLATLTMATVAGLTLVTACGGPVQVPPQKSLAQAEYEINTLRIQNTNHPTSARQGPFKTLQADNGHTVQIYQNGSRIIDNVPFVVQGDDNTCGQAVLTSMLNFWGHKMPYQQVVNEANPHNLPTTDYGIANYLRLKGLAAQPFKGASIDNLIAEVNQGRPSVVLLDFGGITQEHYVIVVGYNTEKKTLIMHDSLSGPYIAMPMDRFDQMWQNKAIRRVHLFAAPNYNRFMLTAQPSETQLASLSTLGQ